MRADSLTNRGGKYLSVERQRTFVKFFCLCFMRRKSVDVVYELCIIIRAGELVSLHDHGMILCIEIWPYITKQGQRR